MNILEKLFNPRHKNEDEHEEEIDEDALSSETFRLAHELKVEDFIKSIKIIEKVDYLEQWKKNYLERLEGLMLWGLRNPRDYGSTVSFIDRFEKFFNNILMLMAQTETIKKYNEEMNKKTPTSTGQEVL
ncbi:MAG: hypothetical protein AABY22_08600 [Nanoarchaeota archaeon]